MSRNVAQSGLTRDGIARAGLVAALAVVLTGCGLLEADTWGERQEALDRNRDLWESQAVGSYTFRLLRSCFCPVGGEFTVTVSDGAVVAAERTDGSPVPAEDLQYLQTIDDLFDVIQTAIDYRADRFEAEYDRDVGYPALIDLDSDRNAVDDEVHYEATLYFPLSP